MSMEHKLSIVMPCLDEARTVGICTGKALGFLARYGVAGEVVVADNGSRDGSQATALAAGARVVNVPYKGYGHALRGGIEASEGKYVIMGDADNSYDFAALDRFVDLLRDGYDMVMGNRFAGGIQPGVMPLLHRYVGNPVLSFLGRMFFRTQVGDFHCGLRGFTREACHRMHIVSEGMEFASEIVLKAGMLGMRIAEMPVVLYPDGRDRKPHLRSWRDGWRHLKLLLLFCPRWLFLYPCIALMIAGLQYCIEQHYSSSGRLITIPRLLYVDNNNQCIGAIDAVLVANVKSKFVEANRKNQGRNKITEHVLNKIDAMKVDDNPLLMIYNIKWDN